MSKWIRKALCVECKTPLSHTEEYYSDGICPHCGHNSNGTICNTKVKAVRWVVDSQPKWWERFMGKKVIGHWEEK